MTTEIWGATKPLLAMSQAIDQALNNVGNAVVPQLRYILHLRDICWRFSDHKFNWLKPGKIDLPKFHFLEIGDHFTGVCRSPERIT